MKTCDHVIRAVASLGLAAALLWPGTGSAGHDRVPDPPRPTHEKLQTYRTLDRSAVTVSGLSSGGFFAHQFHVAYSKLVNGAGIMAGGPYGCAERIFPPFSLVPLDRVSAATSVCTHYGGALRYEPKVRNLVRFVAAARRQGIIDDPAGLADDRVWLFLGADDEIVPAGVMESVKGLYEALGVREPKLHFEPKDRQPSANHGIPVAKFTGESKFIDRAGQPPRRCGEHGPPYVIECGYEAAELLLRHLYAGRFGNEPKDPHHEGRLIGFDQTEFFDPSDDRTSMNRVGYLYVPATCENDPNNSARSGACRLHIAFHGCHQNVVSIHDDFIRDAGYNRWAAANDIIVLYPQAAKWVWDVPNPLDPFNLLTNPNGCWDFWGYSGSGYYGQNGKQMRAVKAMIDRMLGN